MAIPESMFTRESLEKLRSPEKLDALLKVTSPVGWMGLVAMAVILCSVLVWAFFGSFTEKVSGKGMLLDAGGVSIVSSPSSGVIDNIYISKGDYVDVGELVAVILQGDRESDTSMARFDVNLSTSDKDVMTRVSQFDAKRNQQAISGEIYSGFRGWVDEVPVEEGMMVSAGSPLLRIRRSEGSDELRGVFYVPVDKGKRVEPGMMISLVPNGVDVTQSGSLIGVVRSVSTYPVSSDSLRSTLGNNQLADWIFQSMNSSLVEVSFELVKDEESSSGYLWTSIVGEHKPVTAGSFCTGEVIIDRTPPVKKLFYKMSQWLRSR